MKRWQLGLFGLIGAVAPEIILFYSKRFTMEELQFADWQFAIVSVAYLGLGALVAGIFPYPGTPQAWKAFGVGAALPTVVSGLAAAVRPPSVEPLGPGESLPGTLIDLLAWV